jgi:hypothetical protein
VRLIDASHGNIDPLADISPIRALIEQGCDLDLDALPIVVREKPDLPRPLKNGVVQPAHDGVLHLGPLASSQVRCTPAPRTP